MTMTCTNWLTLVLAADGARQGAAGRPMLAEVAELTSQGSTNGTSELAIALVTWLPALLLLAGVLVLGMILVLGIRTRRRVSIEHSAAKSTAATDTPTSLAVCNVDSRPGPPTDPRVIHAEQVRLVASIQQIKDVHVLASDLLAGAQRLSNALDAKARRLEELLGRVERELAAHTTPPQAANGGSPAVAKTQPQALAQTQPRSVIEAKPATDRAAGMPDLDVFTIELEPSQATGHVQDSPSAPAAGTSITPARATSSQTAIAQPIDGPARDPLTASIYRLADAGRSSIDIARELHEQVGKVELILALRP
jgi:hypothetical protein